MLCVSDVSICLDGLTSGKIKQKKQAGRVVGGLETIKLQDSSALFVYCLRQKRIWRI